MSARFVHTIIIIVICIVTEQGFAQSVPLFNSGIHIKYKGEDLVNKHGSNPTVVDWDNDGLKDLLVGMHFNGWLYLYRNTGDEFLARFDEDFIVLKADKKLIASGDH